MADYLPKFEPGAGVPLTVGATSVVGGRLVEVSTANTIISAAADSAKVLGVAAQDAATGDRVTVFPRSGGVHRLTASGAIAVGARVISAAAGKIATIGSGTNPIGIALTAAAADNDVIDVLFI